MRPHLNFKQRTAKLIRSALFQLKTSASSAQSNASIKHCDVSVSLESAGACALENAYCHRSTLWVSISIKWSPRTQIFMEWRKLLDKDIVLQYLYPRASAAAPNTILRRSALSVECMNIEHCVIECTTSSLWCECGAQTLRHWMHYVRLPY